MSKPHLLIIGARAGSLGEALYEAAAESHYYETVTTAGISEEMVRTDITNTSHIRDMLALVAPQHIVCTVGINEPAGMDREFLRSIMIDSFRVNVISPMEVLRHWVDMTEFWKDHHQQKFIAISSNSARIPRTNSIAYCSSKAALSMALRCAARELARRGDGPLVWGYEPGLLNTVMSREMFPEAPTPENGVGPLHRMEGVGWSGIEPTSLAERILGDLMMDGVAMNGCMIPFDGGEL